MANDRKTGLGSLPAGLLRPTTPPEPAPGPAEAPGPVAASDEADDQAEGRAGGSTPSDPKGPTPRARRKRPPVSTETRGRKLHLPDDVHDRLWQLARQRRQTVSAVAADILDKNLPRFTVSREG